MVTIQINGKLVQAEKGEMLIAVIRRQRIDIPALCHHDAVEPCGSCRLCMVEITKKDWDGWSKFVTSCLYPVEPDLIVSTHSPRVVELRKTILDLYLARSPKSEIIQRMAAEYGITQTSYQEVPDGDNCIMCYACTRVCEELGCNAISAVQRGHKKIIAPPLGEPPVDCVGCLSCANICPTHFIEWNDDNGKRTIWGKQFELVSCKICGKKTITRDFAEYLVRKRNIPANYFEICDDCKRTELTKSMGKIVIAAQEISK
jgi:NADH dehydrogenase/NADH:ubiquinone oxidoreductase subunit G